MLKTVITNCLLIIAMLISGCDSQQQADLIIHNGQIYTVSETASVVEMVAVKDGKILYAGASDKMSALRGESTRILDLQGNTMTPGFIESHGHLLSYGYARMNVDLNNVSSYQEMVEKVKKAVGEAQPGEWILGRGWHQSKWDKAPAENVRGFPVHDALSAVSPNNPVFLGHASGHAAIANARAMEIAGVTGKTQFDDGGEILHKANGQPSGVFVENAEKLIFRHIPKSTPDKDRRALQLGIQGSLANGITTFYDAGSDAKDIAVYKSFLQEGKLDIRLWVMLSGSDTTGLLEHWYQKGPEIGLGDHRLTIRAIKLYCDGALGSRGAWLLDEYSDRRGHTGHATMPMSLIRQVADSALAHGFQLCTHAIGDRANREVLDQYQAAIENNPSAATDHRFRIEHAQHLSLKDIPRFVELGVIASMQGIHMASDRPWAIDRLGQQRIEEGAYVWQKLLSSGAKIINGTDVPVEPVNPIACFYASVTRKTLKGTPDGGYEPGQKMTRQQALRTYTLDAAYGGFEEGLKGSIEAGKLADFTIFSQDIMTVPEEQLLQTKVLYTIVGGKIVYDSTNQIAVN